MRAKKAALLSEREKVEFKIEGRIRAITLKKIEGRRRKKILYTNIDNKDVLYF